MRAHSSLRLGTLRGTTPELLASPWYCAWGFCMVWEAGLPHKTSSPLTQRRNGRACSSLTARGGGLPVGVNGMGLIRSCRSCPDGAASLVCNFSHDLPTFQHYLSTVPVVNGLIGTVKETSLL